MYFHAHKIVKLRHKISCLLVQLCSYCIKHDKNTLLYSVMSTVFY